ncbi:hypothetical protein [Bacillus rubiinfantis]|uniref:hypothetical protein n=1 Tax=Bacillus rubiinfantis TaxID=1499680 RepID=UPI0005A88967|nr:hypothetical protein [Bacillus rubiinfantis]
MKRSDFLREMCHSLFRTVKSVYEPFIGEDLEKMEMAADYALGITWFPISDSGESKIFEMRFIAGKPIIIRKVDTNIQAWGGVCPVCSNIIMVSTLYSSGKCLNCQKEYNFATGTGELRLTPLSTKEDQHIHYVGLQREWKQGELNA